MDLDTVLLSVGRTWRFDTGGRTAVEATKSGYTRQLNRLKGSPEDREFGLPWPPYRSRFWEHMLNSSYQETPTADLVAILLPLRWWRFQVHQDVPGLHPRIEVEAIRHPFALTTIAHFRLRPRDPWPPDAQAADLLNRLTRGDVGPMRPVDEGYPYQELSSLPGTDAGGAAVALRSAGHFTVLSALHREDDALLPAAALARRFPANPTPDGSVALRDGAVHVHADNVGVAVSAQVGARTAGCLHHNYTTLLAYLQNLTGLVTAPPSPEAEWFRERAVWMMNHLYRAAPAPPVHAIYKSRLSALWLDERGLTGPINTVAGELGLGLPPLGPATAGD